MSRKFISLVIATSLTITGFSAIPARAADPDDVARILGAAATLFIIGKAIEMNNDDDKKKSKAKVYVHKTPSAKSHGYHHKQHKKGHAYGHKAKPPVVIGRSYPRHGHANWAPLPRGCLLDVRRGDREFRVFGQRCLERNYRSARPLPSACRLDVKTHRGTRPAYGARCLRKNGYSVASR